MSSSKEDDHFSIASVQHEQIAEKIPLHGCIHEGNCVSSSGVSGIKTSSQELQEDASAKQPMRSQDCVNEGNFVVVVWNRRNFQDSLEVLQNMVQPQTA